MDIHEYQAKELLAGFGVAIPRGGVAYSPEQAVYRAAEIGGSRWAVKAQIHSGARGTIPAIKSKEPPTPIAILTRKRGRFRAIHLSCSGAP